MKFSRLRACITLCLSLITCVTSHSASSTNVNPVDGAEMVYVPAGEFTAGLSEEQATVLCTLHPDWNHAWLDRFKPLRPVRTGGYWIYNHEVTVAQYKKFCSATHRTMPEAPTWGWIDDHPIVNVTWDDAEAYARWAGGRLPSEAEWEKAARGTDGRLYVWGNEWREDFAHRNKEMTAPVGAHPSDLSPYGCMDMAGNAWEWTADSWTNSAYGNPVTDPVESCRVIRGGCWDHYQIVSLACYSKYADQSKGKFNVLGFRLVVDKPLEVEPSQSRKATDKPSASAEEEARAHYFAGEDAYNRGDHRTAISEWLRVLELKPTSERTKKMLAKARTATEQKEMPRYTWPVASPENTASRAYGDSAKKQVGGIVKDIRVSVEVTVGKRPQGRAHIADARLSVENYGPDPRELELLIGAVSSMPRSFSTVGPPLPSRESCHGRVKVVNDGPYNVTDFYLDLRVGGLTYVLIPFEGTLSYPVRIYNRRIGPGGWMDVPVTSGGYYSSYSAYSTKYVILHAFLDGPPWVVTHEVMVL